MKITKKRLRRIIRENMAMRNMIQKSVRDSMDSRDEPSASPRERRRRSDPITRADIVKGSFKGTTAERAKLTDKLRKKIEKLIKDGYEKDVPSNWEEVLMVNNGDALFALSKVVFPGFFGTMMRTLFPANEGKITEAELRKIIREVIEEDVRKRGNQYCAYVDDKVTKKDKENNPKLYKGKKAGSVKRTKSGKIKMKARACYASKKKANNAMAAAMM